MLHSYGLNPFKTSKKWAELWAVTPKTLAYPWKIKYNQGIRTIFTVFIVNKFYDTSKLIEK